ncbi:ABC transporter ATP-binding protein [Candidatus Clostridium stratigraminis]|uniref:ABC transporter ATP-binding protein n=1 Tax=Candidatus Clostridium stratigraminis TaxID=3381661 RepID=A0ABW8T5G6_9CLOT
MEKVLEVKEVTKKYKNGRGIENISFDIYKGDIYGFLGPNGAGKTTLMKIITGLVKADKGEVKIFKYNLNTDFEKAMKRVGAIVEDASAYEYMSAYNNLKLSARLYSNVNKKDIEEVLELVGLSKYKDEKVSDFSLGMKQRLAIASALLARPDFVILDEPTNGLDIEGVVEIRNAIKDLAESKGISFFISSHQIHEIELVCNRVGIIYNGRLIREGQVSEILNNNKESLEDFFIRQLKESRMEA